jgi:hypothetical protein
MKFNIGNKVITNNSYNNDIIANKIGSINNKTFDKSVVYNKNYLNNRDEYYRNQVK